MINKGGRAGEVWSNDHKWDFKIGTPGIDKESTNPEQLFAAGFASCFNGALDLALQQAGISAQLLSCSRRQRCIGALVYKPSRKSDIVRDPKAL